MGAKYSTAGVLKDPTIVNWKDASSPIPWDRNTTPVRTGTGPSDPQIIIGIHNIEGTKRPIIPQEFRNAEPLDASINRIPSTHRYPTPIWRKAIGRKLTNESSADVYARYWMNLVSDAVLTESPNFMYFGLLSIDTREKRGSVFATTNIIG